MHKLASCLMGLLLLAGGPVSADPGVSGASSPREVLTLAVVTCPVGAYRLTYDPPLRNTPQDVRVRGVGAYSNCYTLLGEPVTSATEEADFIRPGYECSDLLNINPVTSDLVWNTGEVSTLQVTQVVVRVDGPLLVATHTGTVKSGKFAGATLVNTFTFTATDLDACGSPEGLSGMNAAQVLVLTRVL